MNEVEILRASLFHTPASDRSHEGLPSARLIAHEDGALAIQHGRILASGEYDSIHARWPEARARDWRGGFLLPGFVDTHTHYPQARIVGRLGRTLIDWLDEVALPEEARHQDVAYARATADHFVGALATHGTTTALVFGAHFAAATASLFEAASRAGLRVVSGLVMSDRRLRPELHQSTTDAYRDCSELIRCFHKKGRLLYAVTPRFALSASEAMMEVCQTLRREHADLRLQTHINESSSEVAECARLFPWARDYLAVYERYDLDGPFSVMAHNVHVPSWSGSRLLEPRSPTARRAISCWAAGCSPCNGTSTPASTSRSAPMSALAPVSLS